LGATPASTIIAFALSVPSSSKTLAVGDYSDAAPKSDAAVALRP
jgi:hypothetical protein